MLPVFSSFVRILLGESCNFNMQFLSHPINAPFLQIKFFPDNL